MEEASGPRADSVGATTLTDVNTVGTAAGIIDQSALFVAANSEYLSAVSNAAISTGDIDFTLMCWVFPNTFSATSLLIAKRNTAADLNIEYLLWLSGNQATMYIGDGVGGNFNGGSTAVLTAGAWHQIFGWWDSAAGTVNVSLDNAAPVTAATAVNPAAFTRPLTIGGFAGGSYADARIDEVGIWKRLLTAPERTALYNAGAGLAFPFGEGGDGIRSSMSTGTGF